MKSDIGLVGLGVMGENLSLNMERNGFALSVWNRELEKTDEFLSTKAKGKRITGTKTFEEFVKSVRTPRRIFLMVKAGDPVDWTIQQLLPYMDKGDILVDGGNSRYQDTIRRERELVAAGFRFLGTGVSGGEFGALWGASIMPGGAKDAYEEWRPVFEAIAAKVPDGPCVTYIGPDGSGHFVKMVHNGIEYGDMQLIAEAYDLLRRALKMNTDELAAVFADWNKGLLNSYLIEITAQILGVKDETTGKPLVDLIVDKAGQKGTGMWTSQIALELGVAIPTIHAAIESRYISALKDQRVAASKVLHAPAKVNFTGEREVFVQQVHDALYASKVCSYAQGMALIRAGSDQHKWNIKLSELARIWKGGCIIRAKLLDSIQSAFRQNPDLPNLMLDPGFAGWIDEAQSRWRKVVSIAATLGIPAPAHTASLAYYDQYRSGELPLNLTQAQRDFFGAHLYERIDQPERGFQHTDWESLIKK